MKTPQRKCLLLACVLTGGLLALGGWYWLEAPPEPEYQGKPLRYWFREYYVSSQLGWEPARQKESQAALRQMGTNAIPYLLQEAFDLESRPAIREHVVQWLNGLPRSLHLPRFLTPTERDIGATLALRAIQPPGAVLLPAVLPHLNSTNLLEHRQALILLGTAGEGAEEVVPYLVKAFQDPDSWSRGCALQSLRWIGPRAKAAVPALTELLRTSGSTNALNYPAVLTLGSIGPAAAPALPLVQELYGKQTNWSHQCAFAGVLYRIDAGQTNAWAFLTNGLMSHQPRSERWQAVGQLGEIGPNAQAAVPLLLAALDGSDAELLSQIPVTLKKIGVAAETFLPQLKTQLKSGDATIRANVAALVLDSAPADPEAQAALLDLIRTNSVFKDYAIDALGRAGPAARQAIPLLREVAAKGPKPASESARQALKRINVPEQTSASPPSHRGPPSPTAGASPQ